MSPLLLVLPSPSACKRCESLRLPDALVASPSSSLARAASFARPPLSFPPSLRPRPAIHTHPTPLSFPLAAHEQARHQARTSLPRPLPSRPEAGQRFARQARHLVDGAVVVVPARPRRRRLELDQRRLVLQPRSLDQRARPARTSYCPSSFLRPAWIRGARRAQRAGSRRQAEALTLG